MAVTASNHPVRVIPVGDERVAMSEVGGNGYDEIRLRARVAPRTANRLLNDVGTLRLSTQHFDLAHMTRSWEALLSSVTIDPLTNDDESVVAVEVVFAMVQR